MKIKVYIGILLIGAAAGSCTNLRPSEDTVNPPVVTKSTLNVTVKLAGAGWNVGALTNVGLVLVPMTNSNAVTAIDVKYDWSNQAVYLNPSASFTFTFTNITKNLAPAGAGKYGLFIFKDTNGDLLPTPNTLGLTEPQPDSMTNIVIDGASTYNVTFQKIRATFIVTLPGTNAGKPYVLYLDPDPILLSLYPALFTEKAYPGTIPSSNSLAITNVQTYDAPVTYYIACFFDITNYLVRDSGYDWEGHYDFLSVPISRTISLTDPNIITFDVSVIP